MSTYDPQDAVVPEPELWPVGGEAKEQPPHEETHEGVTATAKEEAPQLASPFVTEDFEVRVLEQLRTSLFVLYRQACRNVTSEHPERRTVPSSAMCSTPWTVC